jgi:hypothetical protein
VAAGSRVVVDRSEIVDYRWLAIDDALDQRARGEIALPPPTFVSLTELRPFERTVAVADYFEGRPIARFVPRIVEFDEGRCALYQEDAGYASLDLKAAGARHRLTMLKSGWEYLTEY